MYEKHLLSIKAILWLHIRAIFESLYSWQPCCFPFLRCPVLESARGGGHSYMSADIMCLSIYSLFDVNLTPNDPVILLQATPNNRPLFSKFQRAHFENFVYFHANLTKFTPNDPLFWEVPPKRLLHFDPTPNDPPFFLRNPTPNSPTPQFSFPSISTWHTRHFHIRVRHPPPRDRATIVFLNIDNINSSL